MADILSKSRRSANMALIRSHGNKATEIALIAFFRAYRVKGWRRKQKVFGKPDFVFPKSKVAIFVDGCFWHFCPKHGRLPTSNQRYWKNKLARNQLRDKIVNMTLRKANWRVIRIRECELRIALKSGSEIRLITKIRGAVELRDSRHKIVINAQIPIRSSQNLRINML